MNLNDQKNKYRALNDWFCTAEGKKVQLNATQYLATLWPKEKNGILLQLGACGDNHWLKMAHFRQKWVVTPCLDTPYPVSLVASPFHLPFEKNSVSLIIAPFSMEMFGRDAHQLLFEIDRVLSPMGHVIFLGINPWSLWAMRFRYHLMTDWALKQKLLKKGYIFKSLQSFYYLPPWCSEIYLKKLFFLNEIGQFFPIMPAGFYLLMMQKFEEQTTHKIALSRQNALFIKPAPKLIYGAFDKSARLT